MHSLLITLGDWMMLLAAIGGLVFAISYATFFHWTKTAAGRALLSFVVSLDLVFAVNVIGRFFPDYPGRGIVRLIVYGMVLISVWALVFVLWRSWRKGEGSLHVEPRETGSTPQA